MFMPDPQAPERRDDSWRGPWGSRAVDPPAGAPPADEDTLFYAERAPQAAFMGWALVTAMFLPFALVAPEMILPGMAMSFALTWANAKRFRFELTRSTLRYRPGAFGPVAVLWLDSVLEVEVRDARGNKIAWNGPRPETGHLVLTTREGELTIPGIKDPAEAASAFREIKGWTRLSEPA
jgi:hypothetical protein